MHFAYFYLESIKSTVRDNFKYVLLWFRGKVSWGVLVTRINGNEVSSNYENCVESDTKIDYKTS